MRRMSSVRAVRVVDRRAVCALRVVIWVRVWVVRVVREEDGGGGFVVVEVVVRGGRVGRVLFR